LQKQRQAGAAASFKEAREKGDKCGHISVGGNKYHSSVGNARNTHVALCVQGRFTALTFAVPCLRPAPPPYVWNSRGRVSIKPVAPSKAIDAIASEAKRMLSLLNFVTIPVKKRTAAKNTVAST
jgi:hypothetical protein